MPRRSLTLLFAVLPVAMVLVAFGLTTEHIEERPPTAPAADGETTAAGDTSLPPLPSAVAAFPAAARPAPNTAAVAEKRSSPEPRPASDQGGSGEVPAEILQLTDEAHKAVVVDLTRHRMMIYEATPDGPRQLADLRVSIGESGSGKRREGDMKTPVGVYFVQSFIPDERLPALYGAGAFPVNYPNLWDRRLARTGSGIWVHGNDPSEGVRPLRSSRGCVTLDNADFADLFDHVEVGTTPVIFTDGAEWKRHDEVLAERAELLTSIESWRASWSAKDTETYIGHYSQDFRTRSMSRSRWVAHKRRVNAGKRFIDVRLDDLSLFRYPGESDLILADFEQRYRSDNFNKVTRKRQYWRREADGWRIVHEGSV